MKEYEGPYLNKIGNNNWSPKFIIFDDPLSCNKIICRIFIERNINHVGQIAAFHREMSTPVYIGVTHTNSPPYLYPLPPTRKGNVFMVVCLPCKNAALCIFLYFSATQRYWIRLYNAENRQNRTILREQICLDDEINFWRSKNVCRPQQQR